MSESEISLSVYNICKVFLCEFLIFRPGYFPVLFESAPVRLFSSQACIILEIFHQCHQRIGWQQLEICLLLHKDINGHLFFLLCNRQYRSLGYPPSSHQPVNDFIQRSLVTDVKLCRCHFIFCFRNVIPANTCSGGTADLRNSQRKYFFTNCFTFSCGK